MKLIGLALTAISLAATAILGQSLPEEPELQARLLEDGRIQIAWPSNAGNFILEETQAITVPALWRPVEAVPQDSGGNRAVTIAPNQQSLFLRLSVPGLTTISASSPADRETDVAVTRETILHFNAPLHPQAVITTSNFFATFGGRKILSRVELASDRRRASLFYLEPLPGSARVGVFFDGDSVLDAAGNPVDADGDGTAGGMGAISFDTLSLSELEGTAVIGTVYASELDPTAGNKPLEGVTITVDGREQDLRTTTDASGKFVLSPVPPGKFFVKIDGRTAQGSSYPNSAYYPYVGKNWYAVAGKTNNLAGGTGEIFLPLIQPNTLRPVSATEDTPVTFPISLIEANPALAGASITVPANSLFADDGTRGGRVGLAPVPPDRLPGPLPPGAEMPLVVTVQTDGPLNFDRPAPVCFPNLPNPTTGQAWPAGTKGSLISFNHKKGVWEAVGDMTVSADGTIFCTDPGVGILQPGWHGVQVPRAQTPPPPPVRKCFPNTTFLLLCLTMADLHDLFCIQRLEAAQIRKLAVCTSFAKHGFVERAQECLAEKDVIWEADMRGCRGALKLRIENCDLCWNKGSEMRKVAPLKQLATSPDAEDSVAAEIGGILETIRTSLSPYLQTGTEVPEELVMEISQMIDQANAAAGGDAAAYLEQSLLEMEQAIAATIRETGTDADNLDTSNAPVYPVLYAARISRGDEITTLRGETESNGQYTLFVPPDGKLLDITFYDPRSDTFAFIAPNQDPGARYALPRFILVPIPEDAADFDRDGIADVVERVIGTDPESADSDGDGIPDGAEVDQGSDPLDGFIARTGIVGTVRTPGAAIDITAGEGIAAAALGSAGVAVLDIVQPNNPRMLLQVDTPGTARRVAFSDQFVAVADGAFGLAILDMSDPIRARIARQVILPTVQSVTASGGMAYAGSASGLIAAVELSSGFVLDRLNVTNAVHDLALEGDYLYALTFDRLHVISITNGLRHVGSAASPVVTRPNERLFVGGSIAYAVHGEGYNNFDLSNPAQPTLITAGDTLQFGWRQLVANGSGLGLAAVGPNSTDDGPHDVSLYDLSNPQANGVVITTFPTPGRARALSIYRGLAYVADDQAGVQVVNYLPYDSQKVAPTISLRRNFETSGVEEGKPARLTASVTDDVQVRNVEFYVNDVKVFTDGAFPFEYRFITPTRSETNTSFTVRARAVDTGGNFAWSDEFTTSLLPDGTGPLVTRAGPIPGDRDLKTVFAFFNEPIDPATLAGAFQVSPAAGGTPILGGSIEYQPESRLARLTFPVPLPDGLYRASITNTVTDPAGNPMAEAFSWEFRAADAHFWVGGDGAWNDPLRWSTGTVPGSNDTVVIDNPAGATVSTPRNVTARARRIILGNRLFVGDSALQGAIVEQVGVGRIQFSSSQNNLLDGVTVDGGIDLSTGGVFRIRNGLQLTTGGVPGGTLRIGSTSTFGNVAFEGTQTFGPGTIEFVGTQNAIVGIMGASTLTLGPGVLVRGRDGILGQPLFNLTGTQELINHGVIHADVTGRAITVTSDRIENHGSIRANRGNVTITAGNWSNAGELTADGGTLTLDGRWKNTGTISLASGVLNIDSTESVSLPLADIGQITRTGGTLYLQTVVDNNGGTLALNAATGNWILDSGGILGGTVTQTDDGRLQFNSSQANVLDGVTVEGGLDLGEGGVFRVRNGLQLTTGGQPGGILRLGNPGSRSAQVGFEGDQTFGPATVEFVGSFPAMLGIIGPSTLTLGPDTLVRGRTGQVGTPLFTITGTQRLVNNGTIIADVAGGTITVNPDEFVNNGTATSANGGQLVLP